jgi:nucleoside-diphosphate-sugar epimerase
MSAGAQSLAGAAVLVTGGAGFIGSHLVEALLAHGARVRVLDDLSSGKRAHLAAAAARIEWIEGDVRSWETCRAACRGQSAVFHLAALGSVPRSLEWPSETIAVNVSGTANLLAAARDAGCARFVYASSSSVYGDSSVSPKTEGAEGRPLSPYALSKRVDEELAETFARCFGLECVGLRYFNVYGPRQDPSGPYAAVVPRFFAALLGGAPAQIFGDGLQSRDFTYVADAVAATVAAALAPPRACGRAYNVGTGRATTLLDLEATIRRLAGGGPPPRHLPARAGDVPHSLAATGAATAELGFAARWTLEAGLARCLAAFRPANARGTAAATPRLASPAPA